MKKSFTVISSLLLSVTIAFAQIPNGDLESWKSTPNPSGDAYEEPIGWSTTNFLAPLFGVSVTKVMEASNGTFAMKLESNSTFAGMAGPGGIDFPNKTVKGISYSQNPTSFSGNLKGDIKPGDTAGVIINFTRYNDVTKQTTTVGEAKYLVIGQVASYISFSEPIILIGQPDTMKLFVFSSNPKKPVAGSVLFVDNLSLTVPLGVSKSLFELNGSVYPNPCKDMIVFDNLKPEFKTLELSDLDGKSALRVETNEGKIEVNTSNLGEGIYIYKWTDQKGIPQRTGKFSVIK